MTSAQAHERRYQDVNGAYQLPNDTTEHDRLEIQALGLAKLLADRPCQTPLSKPRRILDVGCGTGVVTTWLAKQHPDAEVIGVDISAVPGIHEKPPNVTYLRGNVMDAAWRASQPLMAEGGFDYIFSRLLLFGMTDWPNYIATLAGLAMAGGWIELQEAEFGAIYDRNDAKVPQSQIQHMLDMAEDAKATAGIDLLIAPKISSLCHEAGLVNVLQRFFKWPCSPPLPPNQGTAGLLWAAYERNQRGMIETTIRKISAGKRSPEELQEMLRQAEERHDTMRPGEYSRFYVTCAQRS